MRQLSIKKIVLGIAAMVLVMGTFVACGNNPSGTYAIRVVTAGGMALQEVEIKVYTDETKSDIVAAGRTDEKGLFSFESEGSVGHVIYLEEVPVGYEMQDSYKIKSQDTEIALESKLLSVDDIDGVSFRLGNVFADFSVTAPDGTVYKISEILKEKKAVVLNFWYIGCAPCKMEFPYLEEAYGKYKDDIEVLAINTVDGTNENITQFKEENQYTFPMMVGTEGWAEHINMASFPTTLIIDRYGTIGYFHHGMLMSASEFETLFEYFTAEDYVQSTVRNLNAIEKQD